MQEQEAGVMKLGHSCLQLRYVRCMFVLDEGETIRHPHAPRSNQGNSMSAKTSRKYEKTYYYAKKIA